MQPLKRRYSARSDLADAYAHSKLERRDFLLKLSLYAVEPLGRVIIKISS
jgi:hypothetical protein